MTRGHSARFDIDEPTNTQRVDTQTARSVVNIADAPPNVGPTLMMRLGGKNGEKQNEPPTKYATRVLHGKQKRELTARERMITPIAFRDVLLEIARSVKQ